MTGIEMTHVPYKGSADAIKDVVAGHIQVMFSDMAPSMPLIRSGTVRALGVTTHDALADRAGHPAAQRGRRAGLRRRGLVHGVGLGRHAEADRRAAARRVSRPSWALPDVQEAVNRTGVVPVVSPPLAELPKFIVTEKERWGKVVQQAGLAGTL